MPQPAFDTLEATRFLKKAGLASEHAEAIASVVRTSPDNLLPKGDLEAFEARLLGEISGLRGDFKAGLRALKFQLMLAMVSCCALTIAAIGLMLQLFHP